MFPSTSVAERIPLFSITLRNAREKVEGATGSWKALAMLNWRSYSCLCYQYTVHGKEEAWDRDAVVMAQPPAATPKTGNSLDVCRVNEINWVLIR